MNCPVCETPELLMSERQGIEIDYCPQCRGVWLDRGELDKMIERSSNLSPRPRMENQAPPHSNQDRTGRGYSDSHQGGYYKKKKREGFLSDLFDFD
ncbi:MAG TPA: zf-TFIIB domain-containing protein [Blastocatellia bacterium]|nr:zf-TFIIB domain-containing protein [Blastocatellia bacterium]